MARTFASFDDLKTALEALGPEENIAAVQLTPELAADILAHDPVNRKVRGSNLAKLKREIEGGYWDPRKSTPLRFLPAMKLVDGQHRCRAVVDTNIAIVVSICVVPDTVGVDEGAGRTLVDHLQLSHGLDETRATLVSVVTKALCHIPSPGNRDYLAFYESDQAFILECAEKPIDWLKDQMHPVALIFKPPVVATLRARAIRENKEPAESVDQLLVDAINGGTTAPEGTPRRAIAKQLFDAMLAAFETKKTKRADMLKWVLAALKFEREGVLKNILTAKLPGDKKRRGKKPAVAAPIFATIDQTGGEQSSVGV